MWQTNKQDANKLLTSATPVASEQIVSTVIFKPELPCNEFSLIISSNFIQCYFQTFRCLKSMIFNVSWKLSGETIKMLIQSYNPYPRITRFSFFLLARVLRNPIDILARSICAPKSSLLVYRLRKNRALVCTFEQKKELLTPWRQKEKEQIFIYVPVQIQKVTKNHFLQRKKFLKKFSQARANLIQIL